MVKALETFLQQYIGRPYSQCDCWDITKLYYKEVLGIDITLVSDYGIPEDSEKYRKKISKIVEIHKCNFIKVDTLKIGDIILFNILGLPAHVGVYIGEKKFLHSIKEVGCTVEPLSKWERKVEGYFRWPEQD